MIPWRITTAWWQLIWCSTTGWLSPLRTSLPSTPAAVRFLDTRRSSVLHAHIGIFFAAILTSVGMVKAQCPADTYRDPAVGSCHSCFDLCHPKGKIYVRDNRDCKLYCPDYGHKDDVDIRTTPVTTSNYIDSDVAATDASKTATLTSVSNGSTVKEEPVVCPISGRHGMDLHKIVLSLVVLVVLLVFVIVAMFIYYRRRIKHLGHRDKAEAKYEKITTNSSLDSIEDPIHNDALTSIHVPSTSSDVCKSNSNDTTPNQQFQVLM